MSAKKQPKKKPKPKKSSDDLFASFGVLAIYEYAHDRWPNLTKPQFGEASRRLVVGHTHGCVSLDATLNAIMKRLERRYGAPLSAEEICRNKIAAAELSVAQMDQPVCQTPRQSTPTQPAVRKKPQ